MVANADCWQFSFYKKPWGASNCLQICDRLTTSAITHTRRTIRNCKANNRVIIISKLKICWNVDYCIAWMNVQFMGAPVLSISKWDLNENVNFWINIEIDILPFGILVNVLKICKYFKFFKHNYMTWSLDGCTTLSLIITLNGWWCPTYSFSFWLVCC